MKLFVKISIAAVILMLIPLIILSVYMNSHLKQNNYNAARAQNSQLVSSEIRFLDNKFGDILAEMKRLSENRTIVDIASKRNTSPAGSPFDSKPAAELLNDYSEFADVYAVEMLDKADIVIYSSEEGAAGKPSQFPDNGAEIAVNGVFPLVTFNDIPVFAVEKKIYSPDNEIIGKLRFIFRVEAVSDMAEIPGGKDRYKLIIMDNSDQVIETPFKTVRTFDWYAEYMTFSNVITDYKSSDNKTDLSDNYDYTYNKRDKSVCVGYSPSCGWYIIGIANLSEYNSRNSTPSLFIWFIAAGVIILMVIAVRFCVDPLNKIIKFLENRRKGDNSAALGFNGKDEFGAIAYLFNTLIDDLSGKELRYRTISEMTDNIVFDVDLSKNTVVVSNNYDKKFSFRPKDNSLEESFLYKAYIFKDDKTKFQNDLNKIMTTEDSWHGEYRMKSLYGDFTWMSIQAKKLHNRNNVPTRIVGVMADINREKESELHLIQRASFDALTQLYNRETFLKKLSAETAQITGKGSLTAVMFLDLDDFKFFNDEYGHNCGDEVLKFTADTIKELCYGRGFGGRFGGDEFVMTLTDLKLIGDAGKAAEELIEVMNSGFDSATGVHLHIGCSIGIAFYGENGNSPGDVIAAADSAMYKIKKHGKSNYAYATAGDTPGRNAEDEFSPIESDSN